MKALQTFIVGGVAAVILGVFDVWAVLQLYDAARSYNWPHLTGRIVRSVARSKVMTGRHGEFISYWPDVRYEYVVGDSRFVGDRIMFAHRGFSESETQRLIATYPLNKIIAVYFDPKNPASAVLEPGIWWVLVPILAFAIILTALMVWIMYADLRGQLSPQHGRLDVTSQEQAGAKTYHHNNVILFTAAIGFAAILYKGLLPDAPLWPMIGAVAFAVLVLLYQLFR